MARSTHSDRSADRLWRTRWSDVWPFIAVALIGMAILPFGWRDVSTWVVGLFVLLTVLTLVMIAIGVNRHRRSWLTTASPMMVFLVLAAARYIAGPKVGPGLAPLVLLPVLWIALRGTRVELIVAGVLSAAFFWVPVAFVGPPVYLPSDWYRGVLCAAIALLVAPVIQRGVRQLAAANAQEREASQRARAVTTRWRTLLAQLPDTVVAAVGERDGRLAGLDTLGGSEELQDQFGTIIRRHPEAMRKLFAQALHGRAEVELPDEPSGRTLAAVAVPLPDTTPVQTLLMVRDVSRDKQREWALDRSRRQLAYLAEHDPISGLLNRRRFDDLLGDHLENTENGALLLLDLDKFKDVNDTLGHAAGDDLIIRVAGILRDELRGDDAAARFGGDEFAVLLPDAGQAAAEAVAGRLVERIRGLTSILGSQYPPVTASVGVVTIGLARSHGIDPMTLADIMLYQAKAGGRDRYAAFDEGKPQLTAAGRTAVWQGRINEALQEDALVLQLQPIVDLSDDSLLGAEALVRLREDGRLIPPGEFIEAAERSELITRLDCQVIGKGIGILADLRRHESRLRLSINVSGRSLGQEVLEQTVLEALSNHRVPGSALILEVTETAAVADVDRARVFAERMKELGCSLSLDDFGAGYGTFARLKYLSFDYVKIYGEFVAAALDSEVDRSLMRSIIKVAHDLGKAVVAEYVADQQTLDLVRREGADFAQGFHLGKPMLPEEFIDRFLTGRPARPAEIS